MASHRIHADDSQLNYLLVGDADNDEYLKTAAHVEACTTCRLRLESLSGAACFDEEARQFLSDYPWAELSRSDSGKVDAHARLGQAQRLDFLSPPSHPEMLGRLGRYEIEEVIGVGGMGIVLKAFDTELNRPIAIKVLAQHLAYRGAARKRFAREAKAAAAVVHEHVVAIHNVEAERDFPFLVMQYVAGESLQARVDRTGPLETKEILRIGVQAAAGLAAAHEQGVLHRDVKPANILLEAGVERVLLTDFGLARTGDDASLTHTGVVAGTPHYMSPEQAGGETTDHRTDLFSLGSVLYFMATGHPPFRAEQAMGVLNRICHRPHRPVWQINSDIPDALSDIIDQLLEKKPARRFASASEVKETLARLLSVVQLHQPNRLSWLRRLFRRRRRQVLWLGGAAAAVAAASTILPIPFADQSQSLPRRHDGTTASPPVAEVGATHAQGLWEEPGAATSAIQELSERVERLRAKSSASRFSRPSTQHFAREIQVIETTLDRLNQESFPSILQPHHKGAHR